MSPAPAVTVAEVRQRVAALCEAVVGWSELPLPYDLASEDRQTWRHKGFSVGVESTEYPAQKQRTDRTPALTSVSVFWSWKMQVGTGPLASYDAALGGEAALLDAIMTGRRSSGLLLQVVSCGPRSAVETWITGEIVIEARHTVSLV